MLTAEAAEYWHEAQRVLAYGRLALSGNDRAHKKENALSRKCQELMASFERRVPAVDKGKFVQCDIQRHEQTWDDRWSWTVDGEFPLLSPRFNASMPVSNPDGEAQRMVLYGLLGEPSEVDHQQSVERFRRILAVTNGENLAAKAREQKAVTRQEAQSRRKALIASGDQKATKHKRSPEKLQTELFDGLGRRRR